MNYEWNYKTQKRLENNLKKDEFDLSKEVLEANPFLKNYGRDPLSYWPETTMIDGMFWMNHESELSHGYPYTFHL